MKFDHPYVSGAETMLSQTLYRDAVKIPARRKALPISLRYTESRASILTNSFLNYILNPLL